ncbi:putative transcriptional regulator, LysR family protein [Streptomyces chrestomyceticus JCM 4735]|uniref:Transcriptional regulator, LysR family protein n=1 Tax=Streptomyces chrestomyceticus JCM 4735 TaxID=1306181 RepID=A0A7U9PVC9_9ACTN|nr:LysR family transcriptional regulator [Streptomyces chrestomyceticus]GCD32420.1 putative transcriptional regulator, LysR family protein [Streptomyces chrestomyceticus JCM 4735]
MSERFPTPVDLDLRLVQCFTVVAEHRHFGRAAEALHTTQPSLSRQIRRLEQQVGVRLLDRTTHGTRLSEAGEVFLPQAQGLLRTAVEAMARTRAAARPSSITIGYSKGLVITAAVRALRDRNPDAEVHTRLLAWNDSRGALLEHRVDAVVTRLPFPTDRLRVTVLHDEPRVLVVSRDHRLAGKESVTLGDIADEPIPHVRQSDPLLNAYWRLDPRPDGRPAPDGPLAEALEDKHELIAAGQAVAVGPPLDHATGLHPSLTTVPLHGVEPSQVVLATRTGDRSRLVTAFRSLAEALLTGPHRTGPIHTT